MAGFFKNLFARFSGKPKLEWDELEATLVSSDIGVRTAIAIMDDLQEQGKSTAEDIVRVTRDHIAEILPKARKPLLPFPLKPKVVLVTGVNGTGKTTSTAKLAYLLKQRGHSVMLAAADTFRAAAIEQLEIWANRLEIPIVKGPYKADPSSVCYDAYEAAVKRNVQFLICDTAGRLHNRHNLMEELKKIQRVLGKKDAGSPHEVLLVVDATTGSNALAQAKEFNKAIPLTGLVVTKLDGSGKGGVVVSIQQELGIAPRYIGLGEKVTDFAEFDPDEFISQIL